MIRIIYILRPLYVCILGVFLEGGTIIDAEAILSICNQLTLY